MKKNKKEIEFFKYQLHCHTQLEKLIDDGWERFNINMPPEFILSITFVNAILTSEKLVPEAKKAWLNSYKKIFRELPDNVEEAIKKLSPNKNNKNAEKVKKWVLH